MIIGLGVAAIVIGYCAALLVSINDTPAANRSGRTYWLLLFSWALFLCGTLAVSVGVAVKVFGWAMS